MPTYEIAVGKRAYPQLDAPPARQDDFENLFRTFGDQVDRTRVPRYNRQDPFFELRRLLLILDEINTDLSINYQPMSVDTVTELNDKKFLSVKIYEAGSMNLIAIIQFEVLIQAIDQALRIDRSLTQTQLMHALPVQPGFAQAETATSVTHLGEPAVEEINENDYPIDNQTIHAQALQVFYEQIRLMFIEHQTYYHTPTDPRQEHIIHTRSAEEKMAQDETQDLPPVVTDDDRQVDFVLPYMQADLSYDPDFGIGYVDPAATQPSKPNQQGYSENGKITA